MRREVYFTNGYIRITQLSLEYSLITTKTYHIMMLCTFICELDKQMIKNKL